jgi:putative ABC transport system ATP-binding protein
MDLQAMRDNFAPPSRDALQTVDIEKSFGGFTALNGVSLTVPETSVLAVVGPSGSGKSTLLHCLAGILVPDSGMVLLRDQRIDNLSERERSQLRRSEFGFVFQFGQLVPELTASENVALPLLLGGVRRRDAMARAGEALDSVGLAGLKLRRPGEMSGGQAQRVAIAKALVHEPRIIFADEPTGSLDSATGKAVLDLLHSLTHERGVTLVMVTHDAAVACRADQVVEIRDGHVAVGARS